MTEDDKAGLIYKKMPLIMKGIGAIEKNQENKKQNYTFRGIDDVYNAAHDVLVQHGVFCYPYVMDMQREERKAASGNALFYTILTVDYHFCAEDGSFFVARSMGEAMDSGDKGCNKAMSAAMKVTFLEVFCIPTEEPGKDTENESHDVQPGATRTTKKTTTPPPTDAPACSKCSKIMVKRTGTKGEFWACPGFPQCKNTMNIDQFIADGPSGPQIDPKDEPINAWWARIAMKLKDADVTTARAKPWILDQWEVATTNDLSMNDRAAIEAIADDPERLLMVLGLYERPDEGEDVPF